MMIRNRLLLVVMMLLLVIPVLGQDDEINLTPPEMGSFDPASVAGIDPEDYPVLPEISEHVHQIFAAGQELGNNVDVFSKAGDCMTASPDFFFSFGADDFDLGDYTDLQAVIDYFSASPARDEGYEENSFSNPGLSATDGFNTYSVLDPIWANPEWCAANETPLSCEYRVSRPAFVVIMFGANDVAFMSAIESAADYDYNLRMMVLESIEKGVVPILNTFPGRPEYPEMSLMINQIIIKVGEDYDVPVVNLWLALQDLPGGGIDGVETIHLTVPADGTSTSVFNEDTLQTGYTMRNLVTLQALDHIVRELELLEEESSNDDA